MPQAVFHILFPLILMALFKDWYDSRHKKKTFSLHYVLLAGVVGLVPDIDIAVYWVLHFFGFALAEVHRTFSHNLIIPVILVIGFFIFKNKNFSGWGRHRIKLPIVLLMIAFGIATHLILDFIFNNWIMPFYPLSTFRVGLNLVSFLPQPLDWMFLPSLDAVLLFIWLIYLEWKHKISDFI